MLMPTSTCLPPAFVPTTLDTATMYSDGRTFQLKQHHLSGDLTFSVQSHSGYYSERLTAAEARALIAELQRVVVTPKVAA